MKQKLFWLDLTFCSLWVIAVIGSRSWLQHPMSFFTVVTAMSRVVLSIFLYRSNKHSRIPLSLFWGLTILILFCGYPIGIRELGIYPFYILNIECNRTQLICLNCVYTVWFYVIPTTLYCFSIFRKKFSDTRLNRKDALGAILWKDECAKTYVKLLLVAINAIYVGLAMYLGLSRFACLVLPTLSLYILAKHYNVPLKRIWMMPVSMFLFLTAQTYGGAWRIILLTVSLIMVGFLCYKTFYCNRKLVTLSVIALLYHGIILPSFIIGYNQYTCIEYSRHKGLESFQGIFQIKDPETGQIGLRDRYGLLIAPEYESMAYHGRLHLWGELELRKNGYYDLYDIANNRLSGNPGIEKYLQDKICPIICRHTEYYNYRHDDRIEVIITECDTNTRISHLKSRGNGSTATYDYKEQTFIIPDTANILSGDFKADTLVSIDRWTEKQVLQYSYDVMNDSIRQFNIAIKTARDGRSRRGELLELSSKVEEQLREWWEYRKLE